VRHQIEAQLADYLANPPIVQTKLQVVENPPELQEVS
jgi:hypothetical protein